MSKDKDKLTDEAGQPDTVAASADEELYEEPPRMTVLDSVGVVVALIALVIIGWLGYLWLTPGRSISDAWTFGGGSEPVDTTMAAMHGEVAGDDAAGEPRCEYCGMYADRSLSQVVATYGDGREEAFDSWGCLFNYTRDNGLELASARVVDYTSSLEDPRWLMAESASYLFGLEYVEGSMSPFVAAFADAETAGTQLAELGGEQLDYAGLQAKWNMATGQMSDSQLHESDTTRPDMQDMADGPGMEVEDTGHPAAEETVATDVTPATIDQPHLHEHELRCASCGMFADRSPSQVVGYWTDGSHTHHDCWDCLFNYAADNGLELDHALIKLYNSSLEQPDWIRADTAVYLYGTQPIRGSMPPFIAAFADRAAADQAMAELGGEIRTYSELKANWE